MRLSELAFACFVYAQFTNYDDSYLSFLQAIGHRLDLANSKHRRALLTWLNLWGCRQFAIEYHGLASSEVLFWYNQFNPALFDRNRNLWELTEAEIDSVAQAYEALSNKKAFFRRTKGNISPVSVGPTGAAKILFAIRPNALVAWDDSIREHYGYDGSSASYLAYLHRVRSILEELKDAYNRNGFTLPQLPKQLGRNNSTVPKLIDEYYWITITKDCSLPAQDTF